MLSMSLASIKEMIPNSVDGYSRREAIVVFLLLLDAHRLIRSLERTAKQFVSIKKRDSLHKLHHTLRHSCMHRRAWSRKEKVCNNSKVYLISFEHYLGAQ